MSNYILSIDQGTSSTRSIIFDDEGNMIETSQKEHSQIYPQEAWVEHDPIEIKDSVKYTMNDVVQKSKIGWDDISSIGITNQRETVVAWDKKSGQPLENAIVWQCRRSTPIVNNLKEEGYEKLFHKKTGLVLDAYFSGTKMKWMIDNNDKISTKMAADELAFGTIDSWIIHFLTGEHRTDASNASRTLLYDLHKREWSEDLAEILDINLSTLPEVHPNASDPFGTFKIDGNEIPIRGVLGDQQAALFGQTGFEKGAIKTTYGTGNFTLFNTGKNIEYSDNGLLTTVGWETEKNISYALEGSIFITGAALQWLRDELQILSDFSKVDELASHEQDSGGVIFVPAFVGLGAPHWDSSARGTIIGITGGTNRSHIIRATLDSIAFQTNDLLETMENESGIPIDTMRVDGGITKSDILMQQQADISQIKIEIPRITETTAMGAALMAGLNHIWEDYNSLKLINNTAKSFVPRKTENEITDSIAKWKLAVERSRNWEK